mgnify:CR=1 FL=1
MLYSLTILGLDWSSLSPCPSLPYRPFPHVYNSPADVIQALCAPPAAMATTSLPRSDSITRGLSHGLRKKEKESESQIRSYFKGTPWLTFTFKSSIERYLALTLCRNIHTGNFMGVRKDDFDVFFYTCH